MSTDSDAAYASFLDHQANQDTSGPQSRTTQSQSSSAKTKTKIETKTKTTDTAVPAVLQEIEGEYYTSETDEPFEGVSLRWGGEGDGGWPSEDEFATLIGIHQSTGRGGEGAVSILSAKDFDPKGRYSRVLGVVEKAAAAGGEGVRVYRVSTGGARAEYFVVGLDAEGGRVVGVRARSVES